MSEPTELAKRDAGKRSLPLLSRVRMASPCPEDWSTMLGSDAVRHCDRCERSVYNLSAMSGDEVERLLAASPGGLCARYYERADGMIMTADCHAGRLRRWLDATVAALLVAIVGFTVWQRFGYTVRTGGVHTDLLDTGETPGESELP